MRTCLLLMIAVALAAGDAGPFVYDPVVNVLNTGTVIYVRPVSSFDRKYITLQDLQPQGSRLINTYIEEVRALRLLGVEPFRPRRGEALQGRWRGSLTPPDAEADAAIDCELDIVDWTVGGEVLEKITRLHVLRNADRMRRVDLTLGYTVDKGPERRTLRGAVVGGKQTEWIPCRGAFDETYTAFTGKLAHAGRSYRIELERRPWSLPETTDGTWQARVTIDRRTDYGHGPHVITLELDRGRDLRCTVGFAEKTAATLIRWDRERRNAVVALALTVPDRRKPLRAELNGIFNPDYTAFAGWFECERVGRGRLLLAGEDVQLPRVEELQATAEVEAWQAPDDPHEDE